MLDGSQLAVKEINKLGPVCFNACLLVLSMLCVQGDKKAVMQEMAECLKALHEHGVRRCIVSPHG